MAGIQRAQSAVQKDVREKRKVDSATESHRQMKHARSDVVLHVAVGDAVSDYSHPQFVEWNYTSRPQT